MFAASAFSSLPIATAVGSVYGLSAADTASVGEEVSGFPEYGVTVLVSAQALDTIEGRLPLTINVADESSVSQETMSSNTEVFSSVNEAAKIERLERFIGLGFASGSFASGSFSGLGDGTTFYGGRIFSANIEVSYVVAEGAAVIDAASTSFEVFSAVNETADAQGLPSAIPTYPASITETATGGDSISSIPEYLCRIEDVASASVATSTLVQFVSNVAENAATQGTIGLILEMNPTVTEASSAVDRPFTQYITNPVVADMAQAVDQTEVRLQWETINTSETSDWVLIKTIE